MPKKKNSRNASGSGSIRQRKDGTWEARYSVGTHPGTGKQIRKSIYGSTQREVKDKLIAIQAGITDGSYIEPSKMTVSAWLDVWVAEYLGGVKPRTSENYKDVCRVHLKPELGAVKLSALSAHMIQTLYNKKQKGHADKSGLSPKSIKNINGVIHKALSQAVKLGYIKHNPCNAVELPRMEKKEIKPLDNNAITAFLNAIQGHKWEYLFTVTLFTGMRQSEVLGLSWDCIDFERGIITIDKQLQRDYSLDSTKNSKIRRITPAPSILSLLREQRRCQMEWRLMAGQAWNNNNFVFTNELGSPLVHGTISKTYKRIITDVGFPESRFHDLRHSYATAALSSGDDLKSVQENLGHHDAAFTLNQYGHVTETMKKESAARMEGFIKSVKSG